jgi:hypothetical protein
VEWFYERAPVVGVVNPQTVANSEQKTAAIDMSLWHEVMGIALLGDMASETINFTCYEDSSSSGSFATTTKAATQRSASATANDNKQITISVRADELQTGNRYVKFGLVTGGATGGPAAVVVLGRPRIGPGSDDKLSSVVENKN